ncbi:hypothetical protein KIN20_014083 [Parelaphostrongylus tenuis]|uniref:Uncharacterized protein n=1 Tax=Parelaphostrongylus tenuis TaxID=148309 RepID=A0AAD5MGK4_PARTN|nr:hypothetical protein KIN20_014083 [Parelaphostrongylus tenuis]
MTSEMITSLAKRTRPPQSRESHVWFRISLHHHDSQNLHVEAAPSSGDVWSSSVRKAASPFDPNLVFVQAPNPELTGSGVQVRVSILEGNARVRCSIKCTMKDGSSHDCDGTVNLHSEPSRSDEDVFTSDQSAVNLLGWNMRGHPAQWQHKDKSSHQVSLKQNLNYPSLKQNLNYPSRRVVAWTKGYDGSREFRSLNN